MVHNRPIPSIDVRWCTWICDYLNEFTLVNKCPSKRVQQVNEVRSLLQGRDAMIIHVDAACDTSGRRASVGVGIRNSRGRLIATLNRLLETFVNPLCAEEYAMLEGLHLANRMNLRRITIFSDSLSLVMMLRKETTVCVDVASIIWDVDMIKRCFEFVEIGYVSRNSNGMAHTLARQSLYDGSMLWLSNFPSWLS